MGTFAAGFLIVWFAVVLYVGRLGRRQQQLRAEFEELRAAGWRVDDQDERPTHADAGRTDCQSVPQNNERPTRAKAA